MLPFALLLLLLFLLAGSCGCFSSATSQVAPFDLLYADGVRAYFAQDWPRASELLQRSLHSYSQLREARRKCRGGCQREACFGSQSPFEPWETRFFDRVLQRAECLEECLGRRLGGQPSRYRASRAIQQDFDEREPYNYLQIAFFKVSGGEGGAPCVPQLLMWLPVLGHPLPRPREEQRNSFPQTSSKY